jgi:hypothetical protein
MKLDVLQTFLTRLHFPDNDMLKRNGLGKLASSFQAYPVVDGGRQLCVLLPKGMSPQMAAKMAGPLLCERVIVLEQAASKWNKVFPSLDAKQAVDKEPEAEPSCDIMIVEDEA